MKCCPCQGIEKLFGKRMASGDLKRYRKKGATGATKVLLDALGAQSVEGMTLLDIGGGIGAIQHELLKAGVANATSVEASTAYMATAKEEVERQGLVDRVAYHHGDFVDLAPEIAPADIVTLEKVICCYHDMPSLVGLSSAKASKFYGLVYPRYNIVSRMAFPILNLFLWGMRISMRLFLHSPKAVDAIVRANGLEQRFYRKVWLWQVVVYGRDGA